MADDPQSKGFFRSRRGLLFVLGAVAVVVFVGAFLIVGALLRGGDAPAAEPVTFSSAELGFSAEFPNTPAETNENQQVSGTEVKVTAVQWAEGNALAAISIADLSTFIEGQDVDTMLQNSLNGMATGTQGIVSDQEFTTLSGERAISGTIVPADGGDEVHTIIAVRNGLQYVLIASELDDTEAFFDSFVFLD